MNEVKKIEELEAEEEEVGGGGPEADGEEAAFLDGAGTSLAGRGPVSGHTRNGGRRRRKDLTGQRFGKLEVLGPVRTKSGRTAWHCRCDCGNETIALDGNLCSGRTQSCGCGKGQRLDLTGQRFGKLLVLEPAPNIGRYTAWRCRCDCGKELTVRTNSLTSGRTKSCGCLKGERLDLTGETYGKLTVIGRAPDIGRQAAWRCSCECGNEVVVRMCDLRTGHTRSCGCLMRGPDLTGQVFGRLTVLGPVKGHSKSVSWRCQCECGEEVVVRGDNLRSGGTQSCGCLRRDRMRKRMEGVGDCGR